MKLELKHIVGYLPYGLKWTLQELKTFTMSGLTNETLYTEEGTVLNWEKHDDLPQALFPLLRPLSDIDTEEMATELALYMSDAIREWIDYFNSDFQNKDMAILCAPYPVIEWCFENHYDIYSLIPAGLAIDVNAI